MPRVQSFPALENPGARVLVLGSMPGAASLRAGRYYAHPQNQFWPIMGELFAFAATAPYDERMAYLRCAGIALWDVLESCLRAGSLDSSIVEASIVPNDFAAFFRRHPELCRVCFNGAKAEQAFRRHVLKGSETKEWFRVAAGMEGAPDLFKLPSTSAANATWTYAQKLASWRLALSVSSATQVPDQDTVRCVADPTLRA